MATTPATADRPRDHAEEQTSGHGAHRGSPPVASTASVGRRFVAVTQRAVLDRLPLTAALGALMVGMGLLTGSLWPSLRDTFDDLPGDLNETMGKALAGADLTTAAGWTNAEMVSLIVPLAVIVIAAATIGRGVVGEEDGKTLGVLLSVPLARTTFLLAKTTAMIVHVVLVAVTVALGLWLGSLVGDMGLSAAGIVGVALHTGALGLFFGAVALLLAALTGDPRLTTVGTAAVAGAAFIASFVLPLFDSAAEWARLSPWYYFNSANPLVDGADGSHLTILLLAAAGLIAVAVNIYRHRDLRG